jgi:hypothetical protein
MTIPNQYEEDQSTVVSDSFIFTLHNYCSFSLSPSARTIEAPGIKLVEISWYSYRAGQRSRACLVRERHEFDANRPCRWLCVPRLALDMDLIQLNLDE